MEPTTDGHDDGTDGPDDGAGPPATVVTQRRTYRFPVPPAEVWAAVDDVRRFPRWWSWLRDFDADGDRLAPGLVMQARVVPPLPYVMRLTVEIETVDELRAVHARVSGDLSGPAFLAVEEATGGSDVTVGWRVEMCRPTLRAAARTSRPLLMWGHDRVVERTVRRFRAQLEASGT